jgi:hypothetical protein
MNMEVINLPKAKLENVKGVCWVKKAARFSGKRAKFSVAEGKRVMKMLAGQGLTPSAIDVAADGGFRFEIIAEKQSDQVADPNSWDEVL